MVPGWARRAIVATAAGAAVLLIARVTSRKAVVSAEECDSLLASATVTFVGEGSVQERLRSRLEESRRAWSSDPAFEKVVRRVQDIPGKTTLVRLEIAGDAG